MTDPVDLALAGFQTVISGLAPSGFPALNAAYVYPRESQAWDQQFEPEQLPVGIISQVVGETNTWETMAAGQLVHKWNLLFKLLLFRGKINDRDLAYKVSLLHNDYVRATAVLLAANMSLSGSVDLIGEGRGGRHMYDTIGHVHWMGADYWGVLFLVPIQQTANVQMKA